MKIGVDKALADSYTRPMADLTEVHPQPSSRHQDEKDPWVIVNTGTLEVAGPFTHETANHYARSQPGYHWVAVRLRVGLGGYPTGETLMIFKEHWSHDVEGPS